MSWTTQLAVITQVCFILHVHIIIPYGMRILWCVCTFVCVRMLLTKISGNFRNFSTSCSSRQKERRLTTWSWCTRTSTSYGNLFFVVAGTIQGDSTASDPSWKVWSTSMACEYQPNSPVASKLGTGSRDIPGGKIYRHKHWRLPGVDRALLCFNSETTARQRPIYTVTSNCTGSGGVFYADKHIYIACISQQMREPARKYDRLSRGFQRTMVNVPSLQYIHTACLSAS